jgi:hypothetical protein
MNKIFTKHVWGSWQYNSAKSEAAFFVPGGSAMQILAPWKPSAQIASLATLPPERVRDLDCALSLEIH